VPCLYCLCVLNDDTDGVPEPGRKLTGMSSVIVAAPVLPGKGARAVASIWSMPVVVLVAGLQILTLPENPDFGSGPVGPPFVKPGGAHDGGVAAPAVSKLSSPRFVPSVIEMVKLIL
jgi:hypothetical protein